MAANAAGSTAFNVRTPILLASIAAALVACGGGGGGVDPEAPLAATTAQAAPTAEPPVTASPAPTVATPTTAAGVTVTPADVANTTLAGNQSVRSISALAGGGYAVAWVSQDSATARTLGVQRYDAQGAKAGGETRIAIGAQDDPAIAVLRDGGIVTVAPEARGLVMRRVDSQGVEAIVTASTAAQPVVLALDDGGIAVGWAQDHGGGVQSQHVQRFDAQLRTSGAPVDFPAASADQNVSLRLVAAPGGNFVAGVTHRFQGIGYLQFRIGGHDVGPLFDVNAGLPEYNTTLAPLADGRFALWSAGSTGGYMQMLDAAGRPLGAATPVAVVPETAAGMPDGGWVTVTRQMYGQPTLAQRFDASGSATGASAEAAPGMSRPLLTALLGKGFAMAWNFNGALGDSDVRTQRIAAP